MSSSQFAAYDRDQIAVDRDTLFARALVLATEINGNATGDAWTLGLGVAVFPPALFFLEGDGQRTHEYARLKGEYQALWEAALDKDCAMGGFPPLAE
ncbi:MAG: hypothetical protein K9H25_04890 [Rhodospirillum sp.]|nr:hypothetical protein [Rhodospirillum sp.]MCF8490472.1 hypothetical protein [Rhodospirillum sp.]MCF8500831.1 hypothetical protein [Rhodospirillum sp.]